MECNAVYGSSRAGFSPHSLLCERLENPAAIGACAPRFSWKASHEGRGQAQSAYRIVVASAREKLSAGEYDMWDSGKRDSRQSLDVGYEGAGLGSMGDYAWKVKLWDLDGRESAWSEPASFGTGMLGADSWEANWISYPYPNRNALMFRRAFAARRPIRRAKLLVSGLGYYELYANGERIGDHLLDPAWTDYAKRVYYAGYDIAGALRAGPNAIGVMLGKGWFGTPFPGGEARPSQLILRLQMEYDDGEIEAIASGRDGGWLVSCNGPVRDSSIYAGEEYDARLEQPGWNLPDFAPGGDWARPIVVEAPGGALLAQPLEPIKAVEELKPVALDTPREGIFVADLGQNISGTVEISGLNGPRGKKIELRYAEILGEDGLINAENLRAPVRDTYIMGGSASETFRPRFTYHGFRYVQIEGLDSPPAPESITGRHIRSAVRHIGRFGCSNDMLNRLHRCVAWTEADNLHGLPTDCPQRDERLGWLNDMTVRAEEAMYNFDMDRLYAKWLDDISDTQGPLGAIADIAPASRLYGRRPADPVCSCFVLLPWLMYVHYGDRSAIEKHFSGLLAWNRYLELNSEGGIVDYTSYGDWASPLGESVTDSIGAGAVSATTPGKLMSTGYYCLNCALLGKMAALLGLDADAAELGAKARKSAEALNAKYFSRELGCYASGSQAAQAFPLYLDIASGQGHWHEQGQGQERGRGREQGRGHWHEQGQERGQEQGQGQGQERGQGVGIVPPQARPGVLRRLVEDVEARGVHLATGNQCTKYLVEVLTDCGHGDLALALAAQTSYPSWGFMLENGATTIWERWEDIRSGPLCEMASRNHPMNAAIGAWFYSRLAGIRPCEDAPGFERFRLSPCLPEGLDHAGASLDTVRGLILSSWRRTEAGVDMDVEIPFGAEAEIELRLKDIEPEKLSISESGGSVWDEGRPAGDGRADGAGAERGGAGGERTDGTSSVGSVGDGRCPAEDGRAKDERRPAGDGRTDSAESGCGCARSVQVEPGRTSMVFGSGKYHIAYRFR
ncbi:MAG: glycoside hydrolase family 78 protein [Clostridiales bacterium]|nr:glycoside hydrolase family 78 protein [Clostridiales bacterium]